MVVYKVVHRPRGKSRKRLVSAFMAHRLLRTEYKPGEIVKPKVGKIFAFDLLDNAKRFSHDTANFPSEVWEAEAEGVEKFSPSWGDTLMMLPLRIARQWWDFWAGLRVEDPEIWTSLVIFTAEPFPPGTVVCDNIRLIRKVETDG